VGRTLVYTLHLWPPLGHAKHYTGSTGNLRQRLVDHALGRAARLTQVQAERGGSWVVAQTEPGGKARERQLKNWGGATRRCQVCKAVDGYQAGTLTREQALGQAGWDRATGYERGLLLDILGIDPAAVTGPPESSTAAVPAPRTEPVMRRRATPGVQVTREIEALTDALVSKWSATKAEAGAEPEAGA
jgi:predicted GIY-YIG superfamily endonuclease